MCSQRQDAEPIAPLDSAITSSSQDYLSRSLFVERLADSLIDPQTKTATGLVIGITGDWGSGKSSILNLVEADVKAKYPEAVVFPFNPWLISETKDLIAAFFEDFLALVRFRVRDKTIIKELEKRLNDYVDVVASIGDTQFPGFKKFVQYLKGKFLTRTTTAEGARREAITALLGIKHPVVILIDELDRVSDAEIRVMVQLVKSIADFPNVSYLIAYDPKRVSEALGNGDRKRGHPYLEKIVQLQIPLPILVREETTEFLLRNLGDHAPPKLLPSGWETNERLRQLLDVIAEADIGTPRALKRIVGHFAVISRMVGSEVDWVDLLGYSTLLAVAPQSVAYMRANANKFVGIARLTDSKRSEWITDLKKSLPELETNISLWSLFEFLFPALEDPHFRSTASAPNAISNENVFLTVLRLGLLPGAYSASDIESLVRLTEEQRVAEIRQAVEQGRWNPFQERLRRWLLTETK